MSTLSTVYCTFSISTDFSFSITGPVLFSGKTMLAAAEEGFEAGGSAVFSAGGVHRLSPEGSRSQ